MSVSAILALSSALILSASNSASIVALISLLASLPSADLLTALSMCPTVTSTASACSWNSSKGVCALGVLTSIETSPLPASDRASST